LSDDFEGQRIATEHLIDKGLRDIYLCLDTNSLDTVRGVKTRIRLEGYRNALEIAGIPYDKNKVLFNINSTENGYNCAKKLCSEVAMPFGLCLTNDRTAMGAHRAFKEMGVLVPEDVKMVGYDDIELAAYLTPALTTVHSAKYSMGVQGATQLIDLINGRYKGQQRTHIILGPYLVCRETT